MKSKTKVKRQPDKGIKKIEELAKNMKGVGSIRAGLPSNSNNYPDGTSVIMVGAVHEFGSPEKGIPQRSFMRTTVVENKKKYKKDAAKLMKKAVLGKVTFEKVSDILGLTLQTDIREKIRTLKSPKLKYRKGNPLVDTAHLIESIVYEVER